MRFQLKAVMAMEPTTITLTEEVKAKIYESEHPSYETEYFAIDEIELCERDGWKPGDKVKITIEKIGHEHVSWRRNAYEGIAIQICACGATRKIVYGSIAPPPPSPWEFKSVEEQLEGE